MASRATRSFEAIAPSSYLTLAIELAGTRNEAARRSAVDRAYYSAFMSARDALTSKAYGRFTRSAGSHRQVTDVLETVNTRLAEDLITLRQARNRLTYQPGSQILPRGQSLTGLLEIARAVLDVVVGLPVNPQNFGAPPR